MFKNLTSKSETLIYTGLILTIILALIFVTGTDICLNGRIKSDVWGQFGDIVGGVVGTIFSLVSVLLLYETLRLQRLQNTKQENQILKDQISARFYELLKIQRENSIEISVGEKSGRKVYIQLERELSICYDAISTYANDSQNKLDTSQIINLSFLIFYFGGIGTVSNRIIRNLTHEKYEGKFIDGLLSFLNTTRESWRLEANLDWQPFSGHQSRLGHYYRHLFQTVAYINNQTIINYKDKYDYIKTLRAQLTTQEQIIFLWNTLSEIGEDWEKKSGLNINNQLVTKYNLIKNIPLGHIEKFDYTKLYPLVNYEGLATNTERENLEKMYV